MTARQHLVEAVRSLKLALAATKTDDYQHHREPMVPVGAVRTAINMLDAYSVDPIER